MTPKETAELQRLATGARLVVEVGAAYGYSTVVLARQAECVISIDPHTDMQSKAIFTNNLLDYGVHSKVLAMFTPSQSALKTLRKLVRADLVFIDGDHRYDAIKEDILDGLNLLADGSHCYLACHDYNEVSCPDVAVAIDETQLTGHLTDTLWVAKL